MTNRLARMMVGGALLAALIMAISHGANTGAAWEIRIALIIGLSCVAVGEFLSWHNAATAWHERRIGSVGLWGALGAVLSVGTLYTNFSSSAGNNDFKAGIQKSVLTIQDDTARTESELTAKNNDLLQRVAMAPKRTADAAHAAIARAKADRLWEATGGCTEAKAKNARAFCDDFASASADLAGAKQLMIDREEQKSVAADLNAIRGKRGTGTAMAVSDDQASVLALAGVMRVDQRTARQLDGMVLPLLVQCMLLFGGILLANEHFKDKQKKSWMDLDKWLRRAALTRDIVSGKAALPQLEHDGRTMKLIGSNRVDPPSNGSLIRQPQSGSVDVTINDERAMQEILNRIRTATSPYARA